MTRRARPRRHRCRFSNGPSVLLELKQQDFQSVLNAERRSRLEQQWLIRQFECQRNLLDSVVEDESGRSAFASSLADHILSHSDDSLDSYETLTRELQQLFTRIC